MYNFFNVHNLFKNLKNKLNMKKGYYGKKT